MTAEELIKHFNEAYGMKPWPKTFEVDPETYANACQYVFDKTSHAIRAHDTLFIEIAIGTNRGLKFKNVELIIKGRPVEPRTAAGSLD